LGGEVGCKRLSKAFYARVGKDPVLRPLFPGKSLKCAIEAFSAFLIQFLGGDEEQTQFRWWLSLRESHARFRISPAQREAWLKDMAAALDATPLDGPTRQGLGQFFEHSSAYLLGDQTSPLQHTELAARWNEQCSLDDAIAAIASGRDQEAIALAPHFTSRPSVFVGLLSRMVKSGRASLIHFALNAVEQDQSLATRRYAGRTLLHYAAGAGCLPLVASLLRLGTDPALHDNGGHTPLYRVANECGSKSGPAVVRVLVEAGADVNERSGVTRATALHMAARRGFFEIAQTLLDCGASTKLRDRKGDTPLDRALHCRRPQVAQLLAKRGPIAATQP